MVMDEFQSGGYVLARLAEHSQTLEQGTRGLESNGAARQLQPPPHLPS